MNLSSQPKELATSRLSRQMKKNKIRRNWQYYLWIPHVWPVDSMMKLPWNYLECYETTYKDDHNHGQDQVWLSENGTPILSRTTVLFTDGVQSDSKNGDALGHMLPLPERILYLYTVTSKAGVKTRWVRYIAIHDCLHSSFRGGRLERGRVWMLWWSSCWNTTRERYGTVQGTNGYKVTTLLIYLYVT